MSLYENIHAKRKRGEKMRKKGAKGAPKIGTFKKIAAKQKKKKGKKNGKKISWGTKRFSLDESWQRL